RDLHDADRMRRQTVVGDHALADPEPPGALNPAHGEVTLGGVAAALRLNPRPTAEALARLRVVEDRAVGVDRMLELEVAGLRGVPVLLDPILDEGVWIAAHWCSIRLS